MHRIGPGFRVALFAKAMLLLAIAALFAGLALRLAAGADLWPLRALAAFFFLGLAGFVAWASALGCLDVLRGCADRASGAEALESRRAGHSLRLPDGRFVEFILWNPWQPLVPGRRYTVTFGRHSKVLVRAPELEEEARSSQVAAGLAGGDRAAISAPMDASSPARTVSTSARKSG